MRAPRHDGVTYHKPACHPESSLEIVRVFDFTPQLDARQHAFMRGDDELLSDVRRALGFDIFIGSARKSPALRTRFLAFADCRAGYRRRRRKHFDSDDALTKRRATIADAIQAASRLRCRFDKRRHISAQKFFKTLVAWTSF